jgi:Family of unknown function (DUF6062)
LADTLFLADFRQATATGRCPLCALLETATRRYLALLLNELTLAPDIHQRLARARGLCRPHTVLLQSVEATQKTAGRGTTVLYTTVLQSLRQTLSESLADPTEPPVRTPWRRSPTPTFASKLHTRLLPEGDCLVCTQQHEARDFALATLSEELETAGTSSPLALLYQSSTGACLPHFLALLERVSHDASARWLATLQLQWVTQQETQLEAYRLGEEAQEPPSWERALALTVGLPGAFGKEPEHLAPKRG